jgi:hypothetical protein
MKRRTDGMGIVLSASVGLPAGLPAAVPGVLPGMFPFAAAQVSILTLYYIMPHYCLSACK